MFNETKLELLKIDILFNEFLWVFYMEKLVTLIQVWNSAIKLIEPINHIVSQQQLFEAKMFKWWKVNVNIISFIIFIITFIIFIKMKKILIQINVNKKF